MRRRDVGRFAYGDVDDTPLVARGARCDGERVRRTPPDGAEVARAPDTLTIDGAGVLRCAARGGKLEARLSTAAAAALADAIDDSAQVPALVLGGRRFPLRPRG